MTYRSARNLVLVCLLALAGQGSGSTSPLPPGATTESIVDLGHGYQKVHLLIPDTSGASRHDVVRQTLLKHREKLLGIPSKCSVSPTGAYAIFQDGPSGNVFLYRGADGKRVQLTHFHAGGSIPTVVNFSWHEEDGTVDWHYGTEFRRFSEVVDDE